MQKNQPIKYKFYGSVITLLGGMAILISEMILSHSVTLETVGVAMIAAGAIGFGLHFPGFGGGERS